MAAMTGISSPRTGTDDVARLDVEAGVEVAEVAHLAAVHREVAGHRADLQGVAAAQRVQRPGGLIGLAGLADAHLALS